MSSSQPSTNAWLARDARRIDQHTVFYEAFSGNGMLCNPEAIFRALLASDDMGQLKHVWALEDLNEFAGTMQEFADDPRVRFVKYQSSAYYSALATAKYLINNATFPPQFGKREGQVYVNTWHGTPLKAMGYHVPDGALDTRNVVRNFLSADYLHRAERRHQRHVLVGLPDAQHLSRRDRARGHTPSRPAVRRRHGARGDPVAAQAGRRRCRRRPGDHPLRADVEG